MRSFVMVLISCFLFSSVANSAMLCCLVGGSAPGVVKQTIEDSKKSHGPNCHEKAADAVSAVDGEADNSNQSQTCDCDSCFQKNMLNVLSSHKTTKTHILIPEYIFSFRAIESEPLHSPPIRHS